MFGVAIIASLGWWLFPFSVALYHQARGEQILTPLLVVAAGEDRSGAYACELSPLPEGGMRGLAKQARGHLERALDYQASLPRAYLLLGRVNCLLGNYQHAIRAYVAYSALRPDNPLGHLELGFAYEAGCLSEDAKEAEVVYLGSENCKDPAMSKVVVGEWKRAGITKQHFLRRGSLERKDGNYDEAGIWYQRAMMYDGKHYNSFPLSFPGGKIALLESFVVIDAWKPCPWCNNASGSFAIQDGILEMYYENTIERDKFAYLFRPKVPIGNFTELSFYIRGEQETFLTVETVVDGERTRPYSYEKLPQDWSIISVPMNGKILDEIWIGIHEPQPLTASEHYRLYIDWIALR